MFERTDDTARFARRLGDQRREAVPPQPRCLIRCLKRSPTKPYVAQPTARARNTNYLHLQANHPALGESGLRFTRERSLVRNQPRPFRGSCNLADSAPHAGGSSRGCLNRCLSRPDARRRRPDSREPYVRASPRLTARLSARCVCSVTSVKDPPTHWPAPATLLSK